ncbi:DUF371 domain-containing protein [Candidatus Bathyarchaeota archaeon]|nr:MAG: DUF371 domain-containing protein [Candidatus Bathyarchaeota archaeon]
MQTTEIFFAYGHENIQATHRSTLEITKETGISKRGNCIIAVAADKSVADLSPEFKKNLRIRKAEMTMLIEAGDASDVVHAFGNPHLFLTHPTDIVVRKSSYICSRTLAVKADKAACDLSTKIVQKLKKPNQRVKITLTINV